MTSTTFFLIFIPILAIILLGVNLLLAPHNAYQEKNSSFECGFHSFLGQNRTQFFISFFIYALLFLLFDLEILLVYPYVVSNNINAAYGLTFMLIFFSLLTLGFVFELGKNALSIDSRQVISVSSEDVPQPHSFSSLPLQSALSPDTITLMNDGFDILMQSIPGYVAAITAAVALIVLQVFNDVSGSLAENAPELERLNFTQLANISAGFTQVMGIVDAWQGTVNNTALTMNIQGVQNILPTVEEIQRYSGYITGELYDIMMQAINNDAHIVSFSMGVVYQAFVDTDEGLLDLIETLRGRL